MSSNGAPLLEVSGLNVHYGPAHVLQDVTFEVRDQPVSLIGRNGMGKTTLCNAILQMPPGKASGSIRFQGTELVGRASYRIASAGIGYVPQGRRLFESLTVDEHLRMLAPRRGEHRWTIERVYELFPRLAERKGNGGMQLSGGEQQMLAIARALMTNPALLLLDEPLEGLAPIIVEELTAAIGRMIAQEGTAVILVEQHAETVLTLTQDALVMERGAIVHRAPSRELLNDAATLDRLIGLKIEG